MAVGIMTAVYEAGRIKRSRATKQQMQERYDAVYQIARETKPTGVRFIYYTATTDRWNLVDKQETGYAKIQRAVLHLRRERIIPWSWIVDNTRWMRKPTTWGSLDEMLADAAESYRRMLWDDSPVSVEVWCESESVAGVLYPITSKWDVPLYPIHGQTSDSFAYGAGESYRDDPRTPVVYYFGDHDPHGYEIETQLQAKLLEFSGRDDIEWLRLACDTTDVEQLGLTGPPPKKATWCNALTGERVPWIGPAVQIEAISPNMLRTWLDNAISRHVNQDRLAITRAVEREEREVLTRLANGGGS